MTHGLFPHLLLLSAFCGASLSCSSPSRDITIRSIPSGASLRVNGDYAGQAPVTLSLNRHNPGMPDMSSAIAMAPGFTR